DLARHAAVLDDAVGRLDEAELADDAEDAETAGQPEDRPLERRDEPEPAVEGVVVVAPVEASGLARVAARSGRRYPPPGGELGQRVRLVHELRQLVRPEERVDHARDGPRVHEVLRRELVGVAEVHPLLDRARHAGEPERELLLELLSDGADAAVAEVVDVVHLALAVLEHHELLDDGDDVLARERDAPVLPVEVEADVDPVAPDVAEVVALVREEEPVEDAA